jgi:hypothetical protein
MPMARIMPISFVRSNIASSMVLLMPMRARKKRRPDKMLVDPYSILS